MRPETTSARLGLTLALLASLSGCATLRTPPRELPEHECSFTVLNRTGAPLSVHHIKGWSAVEIGAVNPNEQVSSTTACAEGVAYVWGTPMPPQIGAPVMVPPVFGSVELVPGARARLSLYWP